MNDLMRWRLPWAAAAFFYAVCTSTYALNLHEADYSKVYEGDFNGDEITDLLITANPYNRAAPIYTSVVKFSGGIVIPAVCVNCWEDLIILGGEEGKVIHATNVSLSEWTELVNHVIEKKDFDQNGTTELIIYDLITGGPGYIIASDTSYQTVNMVDYNLDGLLDIEFADKPWQVATNDGGYVTALLNANIDENLRDQANQIISRISFGPDKNTLREFGTDPIMWLWRQTWPNADHNGEFWGNAIPVGPAVDDSALNSKLLSWASDIDDTVTSVSEISKLFGTSASDQNRHHQYDILTQYQLMRMVHSQRQLHEVMTYFWDNHFNTMIMIGGDDTLAKLQTRAEFEDYEAYRSVALGRFGDILDISMRSPAMMLYLHNHNNSATSSANPNEDYARELLELHTVGLDPISGEPPYTTNKGGDVEQVARVLSGWRVANTAGVLNQPLSFAYEDSAHYTDASFAVGSMFNGKGIDTASGEAQGIALRDLLAYHLYTARHICRKMVEYFATDELVRPDPADISKVITIPIVERCIDVYLAHDQSLGGAVAHNYTTGTAGTLNVDINHDGTIDANDLGNMDEVFLAIITFDDVEDRKYAKTIDPDYVNYDHYNDYARHKIKNPIELSVSMVRAYEASIDPSYNHSVYLGAGAYRNMRERIEAMRLEPFKMHLPTGWSENGSYWMHTANLMERIRTVNAFAYGTGTGEFATYNLIPLLEMLGAKTQHDVVDVLFEITQQEDMTPWDGFVRSSLQKQHADSLLGDGFSIYDSDASNRLKQLTSLLMSSKGFQAQ